MKKEEYLNEFQSQANEITQKFVQDFKTKKLSPDDYIKSVSDEFKKELATSGTNIIHKSIMNGVDDNLGLIKGIQQINFDCVMNFKSLIE